MPAADLRVGGLAFVTSVSGRHTHTHCYELISSPLSSCLLHTWTETHTVLWESPLFSIHHPGLTPPSPVTAPLSSCPPLDPLCAFFAGALDMEAVSLVPSGGAGYMLSDMDG